MTRALLLGLLLGALVLLSGLVPSGAAETAAAASRPVIWRYNAPNQTLPFARGERAGAVWAASACWSECGAHCSWGLAACLTRDAQGHCLKLGDACDRYCQRQCRNDGGPLLPDIFDAWE